MVNIKFILQIILNWLGSTPVLEHIPETDHLISLINHDSFETGAFGVYNATTQKSLFNYSTIKGRNP